MNYTDADIKRLIDRVNYLERLPTLEYTPWTDYSATSTIVGWSSFTVKIIRYKKVGKLVFVAYRIVGTSDSTYASFTLPYTNSAEGVGTITTVYGLDNGTALTSPGVCILSPSGSTVTLYKTWAAGGWTNSGTKNANGQFWFETA